jgi:hypothetical protein
MDEPGAGFPRFHQTKEAMMAMKALLGIPVLLALSVSAMAQTPPLPPGGVLNNPDAPPPPQPTNPSGALPLPSTILTPGSGH